MFEWPLLLICIYKLCGRQAHDTDDDGDDEGDDDCDDDCGDGNYDDTWNTSCQATQANVRRGEAIK